MATANVGSLKHIVTHGGTSHRDDFLSCAMVMFDQGGSDTPIYRQDPTKEQLDDPAIAVIDVGRIYDPSKNNYDHHQFQGVGSAPQCSMTLVLRHVRTMVGAYEEAKEQYSWLTFSEVLDTRGAEEAQRRYGISADVLEASMSPIELQILREFSTLKGLTTSSLTALMYGLGRDLLLGLKAGAKRFAELKSGVAKVTKIKGQNWIDVTQIAKDESPMFQIGRFCHHLNIPIAGTISRNPRGEGLMLRRRDGHANIDFGRVRYQTDLKEKVDFVHELGFCATTRDLSLDGATKLIEAAIA